jgi:hypothetical protein
MSEGPEWFAPKRYGFGAGLPISWQGWALVLGYSALIIAGTIFARYSMAAFFSLAAILTATFILICAKTTRGGWRWRWGDGNDPS